MVEVKLSGAVACLGYWAALCVLLQCLSSVIAAASSIGPLDYVSNTSPDYEQLVAGLEVVPSHYDNAFAARDEEEHMLVKRGVKSGIDKKILGPLVNKARPAILHVVDVSIVKAEDVITKSVPSSIQASVRSVLGVDATQHAQPKQCGLYERLCGYVLPSLDGIINKASAYATSITIATLKKHREALADIAVNSIKNQIYLSESARQKLNKRGPKAWYVGQVNKIVQGVMANVRPQVAEMLRSTATKTISSLPAWLRDTVNAVLPASMRLQAGSQVPLIRSGSKARLRRRGIWDTVKNTFTAPVKGLMDPLVKKLWEWELAALAQISQVVESTMGVLEEGIMRVIIATTEQIAGEVLPMFKQSDASFTPGGPINKPKQAQPAKGYSATTNLTGQPSVRPTSPAKQQPARQPSVRQPSPARQPVTRQPSIRH